MRKCSNCGAELEAGQNRCPDCGRKITGGRFEKQQPKKKKSSPLVLVIILLVVALVGVTAAMAIDLLAPQPQVQTPPTTEATVEVTEAPTTEPTEEPTTVPTTEPPPVYFDPLNGTILDAPFDGRIYATTIANTRDASIPHVGAVKADIIMEMFVNGSVVRCLALFSDLSDVEAIGSTRSTRLMFNDIAQHYNAVLTHAGGSSQVLKNARERGITNYNIDSLMRQADPLGKATAYRDKDHPKQKYGEYNLFAVGPGIMAYVEAQGVQISGMPETDYGLVFDEDGTPTGGEDADHISITINYNNKYKKETIMEYDHALGKYVYWQYDKMMTDLITEEPEAFENVVVMIADVTANGIYQTVDFPAGGTGYFACGGQIIPMFWTCDGEDSPFRFFTMDGEPLYFGQGNSYIAISDLDTVVEYNDVPEVVTEPTETVSETAETTASTEAAA